jgi:hypothetical protein
MQKTKIIKILKPLRNIWLFHFLWRIFVASKNFNKKYTQIIVWGIRSKEDTNYTYDLTDTNILYLAHTIAIITNKNHKEILSYINEARNDNELKDYIIKKTKNSKYRKCGSAV